jgi:hypothetical protein
VLAREAWLESIGSRGLKAVNYPARRALG